MSIKTPITIAYGDGIGPEIMEGVLSILEAAGASIAPEKIEVGEKVYLSGNTSGIPKEAWESLARTKIFLKAPITTPQGGGYKSLNVTIRKALGLYANVRPCRSLQPYVATHFPDVDLVIIRENEEDLYAGIEYRPTENVYQCVKVITRAGCEHICQYAFEYAKKFNRKKVTCMSKDNIMKMTDGLFHEVFNEVAKNYPDIKTDHYIIDIGTAKIAANPGIFDVIVTENLYGDIISDVAAEVVGSVGLAGSANIGQEVAMFEAIHGSAPDIAGKDVANPSGLLNAAIQMLIHINQPKVASRVENAWLKTLEEGIHTLDIYQESVSRKKVGTRAFCQAIIDHLGETPSKFPVVNYPSASQHVSMHCIDAKPSRSKVIKNLVGVDLYIENDSPSVSDLVNRLMSLTTSLRLQMLSSRGLAIWPNAQVKNPWIEFVRARFVMDEEYEKGTDQATINRLLDACVDASINIAKTENLYTYDKLRGFSLAQGQ